MVARQLKKNKRNDNIIKKTEKIYNNDYNSTSTLCHIKDKQQNQIVYISFTLGNNK